jgi:hypothetical protein
VAGWIVGLPLTTGPVVVFLAVEHGPHFAARTVVGSLSGAAPETAFCLAYVRASRRGIAAALLAGTLVFAALGAAAEAVPLSPRWAALGPEALVAVAVLTAAIALVPASDGAARAATPPSRWDLPARAAVTTVLVLLFTAIATTIGARLTGLLTVFPLYASVLAVFAQRHAGPAAATRVLRGVLVGLFAYVTFCFAAAALLGRIGTAAAFVCAAAAALTVQAASSVLVRRPEASAAGRLDADDVARA